MNEPIEEIRVRIVRVLAQLLKTDAHKIHGDSRLLEDLMLDSMGRFELLARVSDDFDLKFDPDQAMYVQTVDEACQFVAQYLNASQRTTQIAATKR
jgi:acyl carrier protein